MITGSEKSIKNLLSFIPVFIIDGGISSKPVGDYEMINPETIAKSYLFLHNQDRNAWSWEIELRTWKEKF